MSDENNYIISGGTITNNNISNEPQQSSLEEIVSDANFDSNSLIMGRASSIVTEEQFVFDGDVVRYEEFTGGIQSVYGGVLTVLSLQTEANSLLEGEKLQILRLLMELKWFMEGWLVIFL